MRALISPVRQNIVDALESAGPRSVAELAALLGQAPDALYFHLRHLLRAGLVVEADRRKNGRHVAAIYDLALRPMRLDYAKPARPADVSAVIASALRLATRDFKRAIGRDDVPVQGPERELWGARFKGWVTAAQLAEINVLLHRVSDVIRSGAPGPRTRPVSLSFVLAPSPPSPRAVRAAASERARPSREAPVSKESRS